MGDSVYSCGLAKYVATEHTEDSESFSLRAPLALSAHPARHLHSLAPTARAGVRAVQVSYCAGQVCGIASRIHRIRFAYNRGVLKPFHIEMMHLALGNQCSPRALKAMIQANLDQDRLMGQIGHDEYHFDNNAFEKSYAYIEEQRALTISSLIAKDAPSAWSAFGRLTHTAQDFYAHTNYMDLWLARQPSDATSSEVDPLDPDLIHSPALRSGKVYLLEGLSLIPFLRPLILSLLPSDAHGRMSLDSPTDGPNFKYVFQAAVKRTEIEFENTTKDLPGDLFALFVDK